MRLFAKEQSHLCLVQLRLGDKGRRQRPPVNVTRLIETAKFIGEAVSAHKRVFQ